MCKTQPKYTVRWTKDADDIKAAQQLRHLAFRGEPGQDGDEHDDRCSHVLIETAGAGELVACFRCLELHDGRGIDKSYSAQFYDLERLSKFDGGMIELGRFCTKPGLEDPDLLRIAWGALTHRVDEGGSRFLFGCSSFSGIDGSRYGDVFAKLFASNQAPQTWAPQAKAAEIVRFEARPESDVNHTAAMRQMPPLLRSYLSMGGWVSDHAVVDRDLNTLHVFTGLEIARIPTRRAEALRAVAQSLQS